MKKYLALLVAVVFTVSLFAACGGNNQAGANSVSPNNQSESSGEQPQKDQVADDNRTLTHTYREFGITLPFNYIPNGNDMWSSDEEKTDIRASYVYFSVFEDVGLEPESSSLEDMTEAYVEDNHIEGELLKGDGDYYYIVTEDETDEGPWTRLLLFYISEEAFWEVSFYSPSRSWADVEEQWTSYIETIQFN